LRKYKKEINKKVPKNILIKTEFNADRKFSTWIGGSILSIPVNFIYNAFMTLARLIFGI